MKKKQIIVVKSLRVSTSPTRTLMVSRDPGEVEDVDIYTTSNLGNPSPKKPIKDKAGGIVPRSILGDSSAFTDIENRALADTANTNQLALEKSISAASDDSKSQKRKLIQKQKPPPVVAKPVVGGDMADRPTEYMLTLRGLQDKMTSVRTKTMERSATLLKFLPIYEQTSLNKEAAILASWQERQKEWDRIQNDISRRVNAPKNHSLMMSKTDEFRARTEEYEFLRASVPADDRRNNENVFEWTLRANSVRSIPVGHMFTGLYTEVTDVIKPPVIMRKAKPIGDLLARTNAAQGKVQFFEETPAMLEQKKKYARNLLTLRPRELSLEDASGLCVKSMDLFDWAVDSSQGYFDVNEDVKNKANLLQRGRLEARRSSFGGVFDRKKVKTPDGRSLSGTRRGSRRGSRTSSRAGSRQELEKKEVPVLDGPRILFLSSDEIVFSSKQGEKTYQPITFKNTGTIAFHYEWNVLLDNECSNPPETSNVADTINLNSMNNSLPREHYLSSRSSIYCLKSKGKILPGEEVSTLFAFHNKATVGALTETWMLNTIPRANIAMDPQSLIESSKSLNDKANKLHPMLLSALAASSSAFQSKPLEYDIISPLPVCIRGHTSEIDRSNFSRLKITENIITEIKNTDSNDQIQLIHRKLREPVKIQNIKLRKIKLFEKINYELFGTLGGPYGNGLSLVVTIERMNLFENICDRINLYLPVVYEELNEIKKKASIVFKNTNNTNNTDNNYENGSVESKSNKENKENDLLISLVTNKSAKELKRMYLELFPEKIIEFFDLVTKADIKPLWDFNITTLLQAIESYVDMSKEISGIYDQIKEHEAHELKAVLKVKRRQERVALLDSDEEDEEEEEEEEEEEDEMVTRLRPIPPKHLSVLQSEALRAECFGTLNLLLTHVLPMDQISSIARDVLCRTCDEFDEYRARAMESMAAAAAATGVESTTSQPVTIPPLPSPFSTTEGVAIWAQMINPVTPTDMVPGAKKIEKRKVVPGSAEDIEREKEFQQSQINVYYKKMYDLVSESLYDSIDKMFSNVDAHMECSATQSKERSLYAGESLFNVAVLRGEDSLGGLLCGEPSQSDPQSGEELMDALRRRGSKMIEMPVQRGRIAFINFDGLPFVDSEDGGREGGEGGGGGREGEGKDGKDGDVTGAGGGVVGGVRSVRSAFDVQGQAEQRSLQPLIEAAIGGTSTAVLLFESPLPTFTSSNSSQPSSLPSSLPSSSPSIPTDDDTAVRPYAKHAATKIHELLSIISEKSRAKSLKYRRNKKVNGTLLAYNPIPIVLFFNIIVCETFRELNTQLKNIVNDQHHTPAYPDLAIIPTSSTAISPFAIVRTVTVFILEDLRSPGVVPPEPLLPILSENDDEAPIEIGGREFDEMRMKQWRGLRPHRSDVPDPEPCYTSVTAALSEAFAIASGRFSEIPRMPRKGPVKGNLSEKARFGLLTSEPSFRGASDGEAPVPPALWIEASTRSLFHATDSILQKYNCSENLPFLKTIRNALRGVNKHENTRGQIDERDVTATQRLVTSEIRETMLWIGVIQLMPSALIFLNKIEELNRNIKEILELTDCDEVEKDERITSLKNDISPAAYHFSRLLYIPPVIIASSPHSLSRAMSTMGNNITTPSFRQSLHPPVTPPRFTVVLGGNVRNDKFLALDNLIDSAHTILIAGEMCLPFCSLIRKISLRKYADNGYCNYEIICRNLLFKARSRGCRIILPEDFIMGDEEVTLEMKKKCYQSLDLDARDEGSEYEGETSIFTFSNTDPANIKIDSVASQETATPVKGMGAKKNSFTPTKKRNSTVQVPVAEAVLAAPVRGQKAEANQSDSDVQVVYGFLYDIGPRSIETLKKEIGQTHILFVWGSVGVCEVSLFQTGQRTLITASANIKQPDKAVLQKMASLLVTPAIESKPDPKSKKNNIPEPVIARNESVLTEVPMKSVRTLLIGDSTVEWYSRVLDPDGQLEGDIVGAGKVTYATRKSDVPVGLLSLCHSSILDKGLLMKRLGIPLIFDPAEKDGNGTNEWIYNKEKIIVDEEEEGDEEEEDDDDDE